MNKKFKKICLIGVFILGIALISGCKMKEYGETTKETFTYTYKNLQGQQIKVTNVPKNPKRIVVLGRYTGDVLNFGGNIVGVDTYSKQNPLFKDKLKDTQVISEDNVEGIAKLKPDLIIGLSSAKNADKIKKIAPTILYDYGAYNYLNQPLEIAKAINKTKEGQDWKTNFIKQMSTSGKKIKDKIGKKTTISILENFNKQLTVFGNNFGRGSEILYQGMKLSMPTSVKKITSKKGYATISNEALPQYTGDYLVVSRNPKENNAFMSSSAYKNLKAVKDKHVLLADQRIFNFNDSISLNYQLKFYEKYLLNEK